MTQAAKREMSLPENEMDRFEEVLFQNTPALFTALRVKRADVPAGMYRYEIREENGVPCQLAKGILVDHCGTLLTSDPIQLPASGYLPFSPGELVFPQSGTDTPADFLRRYPPMGRDVMELFIAEPEEKPPFYSGRDELDAQNGCIGHMRGDLEGDLLHHTWWPHCWDAQCNDASFKADLTRVVEWLRVGFAPLRNLEMMDAFCSRYVQAAIPDEDCAYGFRIETRRYRYMLRCTPVKGAYHVYLYCYCKEVMA